MRRVISGVCAAGLVLRLVGSLGGVALGTACMGRRAVRRFYLELRRAGLSQRDADDLTEQYAEGISLSGLLRRDGNGHDDSD
ncbi:MAG: hypothetical protein PHU43_05430 [Candidatus Bipolaricaulis sp.]|nr:hypothetical protein [Candidatus Bipolaricaulis sp.]